MNEFRLKSDFKPSGDQPEAIKKITENIKNGVKDQVLLGVTGSGKTFTMAKVIENIQKPTLIISHNKTLAAQLYQEFKNFFPGNAAHYFVSYYDYYQPEAYIPQTDTYIEKDSKVNEEIDRLRHAATQDLLTRKDVIVVASVSCIYNIGSPENYQQVSLEIKPGQKIRTARHSAPQNLVLSPSSRIKRKDFLLLLASLQYQRNDLDFKPGTYRVRGGEIEINLVTGENLLKIEFFGDEIEKIFISPNSLAPKYKLLSGSYKLFPAHFWVAPQDKINIAIENIKLELQERLKELKKENKTAEAQKLAQRTNYDMEILKETGYCYGIENYSRQLEFREAGSSPYTLIDYYKYAHGDFLLFIDESHMTIPQVRGMYNQDRARKQTLIDYGFRLPSCLDNRPLKFLEFEEKIGQTVFVSATPNEFEKEKSGKNIVEQLIRPTGLIEPAIEIKPIKNQVKDLIKEIKKESVKGRKTLAITLTKRLAEDLSDYLTEEGISSKWLHSEIKTLERTKILTELREGKYNVLVGINLLREGLDLPEVSLVAILDADKEGFLRSETTLIQTMGRAARHIDGRVILYADKITQSMERAINEIKRRRKIQEKYNKKNNITPKTITKKIQEWPFLSKEKEIQAEFGAVHDIKVLEKEMKDAAKNLDFERAADIRDLIKKLKK